MIRRVEELQPGDVLLGCMRRVVSAQVRGTVTVTLARQERYVTGAGELAWRDVHDTVKFRHGHQLVIAD